MHTSNIGWVVTKFVSRQQKKLAYFSTLDDELKLLTLLSTLWLALLMLAMLVKAGPPALEDPLPLLLPFLGCTLFGGDRLRAGEDDLARLFKKKT